MAKHAVRFGLILSSALVLLSSAISCDAAPPPPQPWFIEHFSIGRSTLPNGVSIQVIPNATSRFPAEYLAITNTSQTFLYLTVTEPPDFSPTGPRFVAPPIQFSSESIPVFRVASEKAYVWDVTSIDPPWVLGWAPMAKYLPSDTLNLYVYGDSLKVYSSAYFHYTIVNLESRNIFDDGSGRPANVSIPTSHTIIVPAIYGVSEIDLPLTISYTLNEAYQAETENRIALFFIVVILLGALMWGLVRFVIHQSRKNNADTK